jgi:hypothetical protein
MLIFLAIAVLATVLTFPIVPIGVAMLWQSFVNRWYDDTLVQRLRAEAPAGGQVHAANVTAAIVDVFPTGMGAETAARYLKANGFACAADEANSNADGRLDCKRVIGLFPCGWTWKVRLTLGRDRTVIDRRATLDVVCL